MKKTVQILFLLCLLSSQAYSQDMAVPIELQLNLLLKVASFDRNLETRVGEEIVIGILHQKKYRPSLTVMEDLSRLIEEQMPLKIKTISVRSMNCVYKTIEDLSEFIKRENVDFLYVTPLRAVEIEKITDLTRKNNILSMTGVTEYSERGISVSIGRRSNKPEIIINQKNAIDEGVRFSSNLLNLAKIVK